MEVLKPEQHNRHSFLRRLSFSRSRSRSLLWKADDGARSTTEDQAQKKLFAITFQSLAQRHLEQEHRSYSYGSTGVSRWTPPLSPPVKSLAARDGFSSVDKENRPRFLSPEQAMKVLRSPGLPSLEDLRVMGELVEAASRTWLRDFLIRGGRKFVNSKLSEMAALEMETNKRQRREALVRKIFSRKVGSERDVVVGHPPRPTPVEIAAIREELMKLVLVLHLRE